jgi:WXG100 family type VII secretion target
MTSANFYVTPDMVHGASVNCQLTADQIHDQLDDLRTYVISLEAMWQGVAQDTFQELMHDYDIYARMMHDALVDIGSGLSGNYINYRETEEDNLRNLQPVDGGLMPGQPGFTLPPGRF